VISIIIFTLMFGVFSGFSVVLTGNRSLISGPLDVKNILRIFTDWRFLLSMVLALSSRLVFIIINNQLLKNPVYSKNSTTITAAITATGFIFLVVFNYLFLHEKLSLPQLFGMLFIIAGVVIILR
jgi:drug/metabolite transporter (DMT)-like permease